MTERQSPARGAIGRGTTGVPGNGVPGARARELAAVIAPLLRGLTFDGRAGALIRWTAQTGGEQTAGHGEETVVALPPVSDDVPAAQQVDGILGVLRSAVGSGDGPPRRIVVGDVGVFALARASVSAGADGARTDRAAAADTEHPTPTHAAADPARTTAHALGDRNAVVAGKVAVVTGGAQGFGEEIVRYLHAAGAVVFVADLNGDGARRLAAELNTQPDYADGRTDVAGSAAALAVTAQRAYAVTVDIGSEESVRAMIETIVLEVGGIDLFISNAGVLKAGSVKELSGTDFDLVTRINYTGFFTCTKFAAAVMALQNRAAEAAEAAAQARVTANAGSGRGLAPGPAAGAGPVRGAYLTDIIQINSKSGLEGSNKNGAYAGSKFGGIGLVQSFALELVTDNIKVNAVCPGNFLDGPLWSDPDRGLFVQYLRAGKVPGARSVEDVRRYYESRVPMRRGCTGADVAKAIFYIVEQTYETGQAVPVTGGQVMLS